MMRVDRLDGVERVERREHEVAGFRGDERRLDRLEIPQLADEDDVGILPKRAAHRVRERARVDRHLALADDGAVVTVEELDWILDRHHVGRPRGVHVIHERGERGALAAAGRSGHEHEPSLLFRDLLQDGRQAELGERADGDRDHAQHQADRAALLEDVAAEPPEAGHAVGEIDVLGVLELLPLPGRHDRGGNRDRVLVIEPPVAGRGHEVAAHPHHGKAADLQVQVGGAVLDGDLEQIVHMHRLRPPGDWRLGAVGRRPCREGVRAGTYPGPRLIARLRSRRSAAGGLPRGTPR